MALVSGMPALGIPAQGVVGCAMATAIAMWLQAIAALVILRRDPFYDRFDLLAPDVRRPHGPSIGAQLRLGVPMGAGIAVEVTGFTFMAIFIARLGETPVAGHQIVANLVGLLFMLPLALGNATSTLVAQRIGAGDLADARRLGWHGLQLGLGLATLVAGAVFVARVQVLGLYTGNPVVIAAALPLLAWAVLFHIADATQALAAAVLRAWRIATAPTLIYVLALWGVGLGGGWLLAFDVGGLVPAAWRGAGGFWIAATLGLVLSAIGLVVLLAWVMSQKTRHMAGAGAFRPTAQDPPAHSPPLAPAPSATASAAPAPDAAGG
jgi:MATE family multidrug resistance protein